MIGRLYLLKAIVGIGIISLIFSLISIYEITYQFYVWELYLDSRVVAVVMLLLYVWKKQYLNVSPIIRLLQHFYWKGHAYYFLLILVIYAFPIIIGLVVNDVTYKKLDNTETVILALLFDIPAVFVFSTTSILLEEIIFRGILLSSLRVYYSDILSILFSNILWMVFVLSEIIGMKDLTADSFLLLLLYYFSLGIICSVILIRERTIWIVYTFRIGILILTPLFLTSFLIESDPLWNTESIFFGAEGFITSIIFIGIAFLLNSFHDRKKEIAAV